MKRLTNVEFKQLLLNNPGKKYAFFEDLYLNEQADWNLHVTDGNIKYPLFGATAISGEDIDDSGSPLFNYDWHLDEEMSSVDIYDVLEESDIKDIIQLLQSTTGI